MFRISSKRLILFAVKTIIPNKNKCVIIDGQPGVEIYSLQCFTVLEFIC